jgi:hypothetical protein
MEMYGQLHALLALSSGKQLPVRTGGWVGLRAGIDVEKNILLLSRIEPQFLGRPTRSLVAIPTELCYVLDLQNLLMKMWNQYSEPQSTIRGQVAPFLTRNL